MKNESCLEFFATQKLGQLKIAFSGMINQIARKLEPIK